MNLKIKDTKPLDKDVLAKAAHFLSYLSDRWQDEIGYEDFAQYQTAIAKRLPVGSTKIKLTKFPFEVRFTTSDGVRRFIRVEKDMVVAGVLTTLKDKS